MLSKPAYLKIMRASAWYDLVVTAAFVTPWSFTWMMGVFTGIDVALGLPGEVPALNPMLILLGNLMGSVVVVWAALRLHLNLAVFGRYDAAARFLFGAWQINAVLNGASWLVLVFVLAEIGFGLAQLLPFGEPGADDVHDRGTVRSHIGGNTVGG